MRTDEYYQGILGALGVGEDKGVPEPVWRQEEYLKAIYEAIKAGGGGIKKGTVTLSALWSGNGPYTQTVTVAGATVTSNSKVDVQPEAEALAQMLSDGTLALYVENSNGVLTAYACGAAPTAEMTLQCTVSEVSA